MTFEECVLVRRFMVKLMVKKLRLIEITADLKTVVNSLRKITRYSCAELVRNCC